ncbi:putative malate transporter YflS [Alphaproteobacteria bacterium]|nr:putative malate transporter YflS [Alphaproteobacteria bacterium]GHS95735.1 putative malate transporter YflS [Alphaproteobacteria bacterium]
MKSNTKRKGIFLPRHVHLKPGFSLVLLVIIGGAISILPQPAGVDPRAFPIFGIFMALIIGILMEPYPITVLTLLAFFLCFVFKLITPKEGFDCFGQSVSWLIVFASIASRAFVKTGLGHRMACFFIQKMGHSSLSLAYGLTLSEVALSPMIPSNTARASCLTIPLTVSISESLGSDPKNHTETRVGQFLSLCSMHANQLASALFLTAMASNPLLKDFMEKLGVQVSWLEWFVMACVPCLACILLMPWLIYKLFPPEISTIDNAEELAQQQLETLSAMSQKEWITVFIFLGMLLCWIFGSFLGFHTGIVALGGLCLLLLTNVLDIHDVTGAKDIWNIFIWLSILNAIAGKLAEYGLIQYYSSLLQRELGGLCWQAVLPIVSVLYYFARYFIPGNVLHACAMFSAFAGLLIVCGVPPKLGCMTLAFITAFCGFVTPYATSPCPLYYNTGYIELKLWWKQGVVTGAVYLLIWGILGGAWWKMLGYW